MEIKIWVLFDLFDRFSHKLAILNLTSHCTGSSAVRALDCVAVGCLFDPQGGANTQSLKITWDNGTPFPLQRLGLSRNSRVNVLYKKALLLNFAVNTLTIN